MNVTTSTKLHKACFKCKRTWQKKPPAQTGIDRFSPCPLDSSRRAFEGRQFGAKHDSSSRSSAPTAEPRMDCSSMRSFSFRSASHYRCAPDACGKSLNRSIVRRLLPCQHHRARARRRKQLRRDVASSIIIFRRRIGETTALLSQRMFVSACKKQIALINYRFLQELNNRYS